MVKPDGTIQDGKPAPLAGDAFVGALDREPGDTVGMYQITTGTLSAGQNYALAMTDVAFEIKQAAGSAIPGPVTGTISSDGTAFTYTVDAIPGAEYSVDGVIWQDSHVFAGFAAGANVTFYARMKETTNSTAGAPADTGAITFVLLPQSYNPTLDYQVSGSTGSKVITITPVAGCEYTFDGGANWRSVNTATFTTSQTVTITVATAGAKIYYTTDGSTPTSSSSEYSGPIMLTNSSKVQAFATKSLYGDSVVASADFTKQASSGGNSGGSVAQDTVTFVDYDGKVLKRQTVPRNASASAPAVSER